MVKRLVRARRGYPIGLVAILSVTLVAAAFGLTFWRYEDAQRHGRAVLQDRADRLETQEAANVFSQQRDAMDEYLITGQPNDLAKVASLQAEFFQRTEGLAEGKPGSQARALARLRSANRHLLSEFERLRTNRANVDGRHAGLAGLHPFEDAVLRPLAVFSAGDLVKERAQSRAAESSSQQARLVALLGAILALGAGLGFAVYATRLVRLAARQANALEQTLAERERVDQALSDSEDRLRQAQKMEAVGRLAGGVAHDFNNVLMAITGYNELARADVRPDQHDLRDNIDQVKSAATFAGALTGQLLSFSRRQVVEPRVVEINGVVEELTAMLRPLLGERIELVLEFAAPGTLVEADPAQLQQVVMNLALNARDAMPAGGRVTIAVAGLDLTGANGARPPGHYVQICVSDTGTGMDEETRARAFEPFFTTKAEGKGTGLGLATVHGIVSQSGGDIEVTSAPGEGTTFKICLPRIAATLPETALEHSSQDGAGRRRPTCRPLSIA